MVVNVFYQEERMKKILCIFGLIIFFTGCDSITTKGKFGSVQINNNNHKKNKSNGNAFGHKNPKNPHYKGQTSNNINIQL